MVMKEQRAADRAKDEELARVAAKEQEEYNQKQASEEERRSKLCGKDFRRIYVGMSEKRLCLCNPVTIKAARAGAVKIYQDSANTLITVANGKVFSWINR